MSESAYTKYHLLLFGVFTAVFVQIIAITLGIGVLSGFLTIDPMIYLNSGKAVILLSLVLLLGIWMALSGNLLMPVRRGQRIRKNRRVKRSQKDQQAQGEIV